MGQIKKKLLVYAHYYYPDVASTGQILKELCEGMKDTFDITVICVVPSYSGKVQQKYKIDKYYYENINEVKVIRVRVPEFDKRNKISRIRNLICYFINAIYATFKVGEQNLVFSISQPPILGGLLGVIGKSIKKSKLVYNIQDFNPEQTEVVGYARNKLMLNFARFLDKFSCKMSDMVVVVGRDMQETLKNRFKENNAPKSFIINNWIDENQIYPLKEDHMGVMKFKKMYDLEGKLVFMYSGNIGLYYDLENIIKVIGKFKAREEVAFAFVGDGSVKQKLVNYVKDNELENIKFVPYQDKEELIYSLNAADIHIVTNAKGIKGISVPSKVYGVMACGKSVLGVLEEGSEGRLIIEEASCGLCINPGEYDKLYEAIMYIIDNRELFTMRGLNGREFLEKSLTKEASINKYKEKMADLLGEQVVIEKGINNWV